MEMCVHNDNENENVQEMITVPVILGSVVLNTCASIG